MSKHPLYNLSGLQKNNKSHVLYALANKQIELKLIQDDYEAKISKIRVELSALETTICLFDGDCSKTIEKLNEKTAKTRATQHRYFNNGEAMKLVLETLRLSKEPLTATIIVDTIAERKGLLFKDNVERYAFSKSLSVALNNIAKKGIIKRVGMQNGVGIWGITTN